MKRTRRTRTTSPVRAAICIAAFVAFAGGDAWAFDPSVETNAAAATYFAPTSLISFRMRQPDGVFREFDYGSESTYGVVGARGWTGTVKDGRAKLFSGRDVRERLEYRFENGHLAGYAEGDQRWKLMSLPTPLREEPIGVLWPEMQCGKRNAEKFFDVWRDIGRFRFAYANPNATALLLVEIGLLALALAFTRRRAFSVVGIAVLAVCFVLTVLTGSRSGLFAFMTGAALYVVLRFRKRLFSARRLLLAAGALALVVVCLFGLGGERMTARLLRLDSGRRNVSAAVPRMMADAPGGWGDYAERDNYMTGPGKAYYDWYQPSKEFAMSLTLVSDHLTQLVRVGWFGRFGYLFGWFALVALLALAARRGCGSLPLSIWAAFLIATGFNRLMESWTLWALPVGVTLAAIPAVVRRLRRPDWILALGGSGVLSLTLLGVFAWRGQQPYDAEVRVAKDGPRVCVKNVVRPDRWLVDDGTVFGGGFFSKEMRLYYKKHPDAPGLGYVRSVFDLPKDVHKLVLGGNAGWEFLMGLNDGRFPPDFNMPEKILFISPPFPPSAIPELMLKNVQVKLVTGEFAAAYFEEYRNPPEWVTVVKGTELYQPDWMERVTSL